MTLQRNHYEVLGVPRKATTDDIKKKYRELARKFHPDIAQDKAMGQTIFSQINQAYRVLGDPDRRAQYDASLAAESQAPPPSSNGTGASPFTAPPPSAQNTRLLDEADTAMLQNNIGKVKAICDRILTTDPQNAKALGLLGDVLVQMGKPQDAIAAYRRALQAGPNVSLQNKLARLGGGAPANGSGARPSPPPVPPTNGARPTPPPIPPSNGANKTGQNRTDQGRATTDQGRGEKPSGGLLSRLLGRK